MVEGPKPGSTLDPSPRTLDAMYRELKALDEKFVIRFSGYDEAVKILQEFANRQPSTETVARDLEALARLTEALFKASEKLSCEKFKGVQDRFKELDLRYDQLDEANKEAINAALRGADKAVEKTEANFTKQLDGIETQITQLRASLENNIADVKERVTIIEANRAGTVFQRAETREISGGAARMIFGLIGAAGVIIGTMIAVGSIIVSKLP